MFFNSGDVREEFIVDKHYVDLACNRPTSLFRVAVNCHEVIWSSYI